jgi:hypothetical protein
MITDEECTTSLKSLISSYYIRERHFIVDYGASKYIVPLTEDDDYDVMAHPHVPVPPHMVVQCMDMDLYLNRFFTAIVAGVDDIVEERPYSEASGMYILVQEVKK